MNYSIYVKHTDNTGGYLSVNGKMEWRIRTAKKHLRDVTLEKMRNNDKWKDVRYFAIVAV